MVVFGQYQTGAIDDDDILLLFVYIKRLNLRGGETHILINAYVNIHLCYCAYFSGKPVNADLAMTGELSLLGRVLPVGGIKV